MTRLIILIVAAILLEVYFYKKYLNSIRFLFNTDLKKYKHLIRSVIIYLNIYLIIILGYWIWTLFEGLRFRLIIENNLWDYFILYPFWISIMLIIQVSLILLPIDLIKFVTGVIFSKKKEIIKKAACVVTFGVSTFFVFYVPVRVVIDYKFVETRIVEYRLDDSQKDLDGFKIAFIADVQADWYTNDSRLTNFIESINRTNPDLVLIAGDIITNTPNYISKSAEYLGKIKSKYGVYTCVGDHDNWAYRGNVLKAETR
jgi:hypothetical protein